MSEREIPFQPENIANDVLAMSGKSDVERQQMVNKASHKLAQDYLNCSPEEFRQVFNELAVKSRLDSDKSQKVFCKTADGKIHDELKPNDPSITEIWVGDPYRDKFFNWGNHKLFSAEKEVEKLNHNQSSISQRAGMLKTMLDENKI